MEKCYIIDFNPIGDKGRGYLVALESRKDIPFDIKRTYYTYKVPVNVKRGFHAHKNLEQVLICINGSLKVKCFDGEKAKIYELNSPNKGLYISNLIWREIYDYSDDAILVVLASQFYSEDDYIRSYQEFLNMINKI